MKSYILFALACGMSLTMCVGQSYYPLLRPGKSWDYIHTTPGNICQDDYGIRYVFEGDTLIANKSYFKTYYYSFLQSTEPCYEFYGVDTVRHFNNQQFLREDTIAKQVFLYEVIADSERLLFDFGLAIGDTMTNVSNRMYPHVLSRIDTVLLQNGEIRRHFIFNNGYLSYIESVGNNWSGYGFFCPMCEPPLGASLFLHCVKENGQTLYGSFCKEFITDLENQDHSIQSGISLSPNPTRDLIQIELPTQQLFTINILNSTGRFLRRKVVRDKTTISLRDEPQGIYLLQIIAKNGTKVQTHKIVKMQ